MATSPVFIGTPRIDTANVATANTAKDGTGTITVLTTGATNGTRILEIVVKSQVTTAAGNVCIFLSTDSGTTWRLFDEFLQGVVTSSATSSSYRASRSYTNLLLKDGTHRLGVTTTISQSINVMAFGGDL